MQASLPPPLTAEDRAVISARCLVDARRACERRDNMAALMALADRAYADSLYRNYGLATNDVAGFLVTCTYHTGARRVTFKVDGVTLAYDEAVDIFC